MTDRHQIINDNCLNAMRQMQDNSVDFITTDPPYGLKFMGKQWDHGIPGIEFWAEMLRICKPGSMLAAFGGTRTYHRLTCAIEDAGWEIRDCMMWLYGSGFPKSHNNFGLDGYGTALKPAWEPIILAMKPLDGTYAQNAEKWGVGGINIDESRIPRDEKGLEYKGNTINEFLKAKNIVENKSHAKGRWPANLILDEEVAQALDQMTGVLKSGAVSPMSEAPFAGVYEHGRKSKNVNQFASSKGGASRFFYCAKSSSRERNAGLEGMPFIEKSNGNKWTDQDYRVSNGERPPSAQSGPRQNFHPTVKPLALMCYIIKLLAPPGDPVLLDPFAGSGSTLAAAKQLGIRAIGIEKEAEYCEIARRRIEAIKIESEQLDLFD